MELQQRVPYTRVRSLRTPQLIISVAARLIDTSNIGISFDSTKFNLMFGSVDLIITFTS